MRLRDPGNARSLDDRTRRSMLLQPFVQRPSRIQQDERGMVGGVEGLVFGVLIFVFGTLVVVNAWGVVDTKLAVGAAAREATRAYVEASSAADAHDRATVAAESAMAEHHRSLTAVSLTTGGTSGSGTAPYRRCAPVVARVEAKVARVPLPWLHRAAGSTTVTGRHTEVIDPYRSGVAGTASCDR